MLRVLHRGDHLIENGMSMGYADHAAILEFLERRLVGRKFPDRAAIEALKAEWVSFSTNDPRLYPRHFGTLREMVVTDHNTIALAPGAHGPLDIAVIEEV